MDFQLSRKESCHFLLLCYFWLSLWIDTKPTEDNKEELLITLERESESGLWGNVNEMETKKFSAVWEEINMFAHWSEGTFFCRRHHPLVKRLVSVNARQDP